MVAAAAVIGSAIAVESTPYTQPLPPFQYDAIGVIMRGPGPGWLQAVLIYWNYLFHREAHHHTAHRPIGGGVR